MECSFPHLSQCLKFSNSAAPANLFSSVNKHNENKYQGSLVDDIVKETKSTIKIKINGRTFSIWKNSRTEKALRILSNRKAATARDIAKELGTETRKISDTLHLLLRRGIIEKTPILSFGDNCREYIYYIRGFEDRVIDYILNNALDTDREILEKLIFGKECISSLRLQREYEFRDFTALNNLVKVGAVKKETRKVFDGKRGLLLNIYISPRIKKAERLIKRELKIAEEYIKNGRKEGKELERKVAELIRKVSFKPVDIDINRLKELRKNVKAEFDIIVYLRPYIDGKEVGYVFGRGLVLVVSCKKYANKGDVLELYANTRDLFKNAIPMLVAENISEGVLKEAERREIILVTKNKLRELTNDNN